MKFFPFFGVFRHVYISRDTYVSTCLFGDFTRSSVTVPGTPTVAGLLAYYSTQPKHAPAGCDDPSGIVTIAALTRAITPLRPYLLEASRAMRVRHVGLGLDKHVVSLTEPRLYAQSSRLGRSADTACFPAR